MNTKSISGSFEPIIEKTQPSKISTKPYEKKRVEVVISEMVELIKENKKIEERLKDSPPGHGIIFG